MRKWLNQVGDTRCEAMVIYHKRFMLWMGLMLFALKLGARRQANFEFDSPNALANLNGLSGCDQQTIAHHDTLDHFLGHVPLNDTEALRRKMVRRLIRMKILEKARLRGHFLVVLDGTGQLSFKKRHCPHCLTRKSGGQILYYHHVLEAKLVTPEGLAISVGSEFIENADPDASKQDCELKAFERLAPRLKRNFPQLRMCLCLDGLYANGTAMSLCRENNWKFIIVFKEGSMPAVWQEYRTLLKLCPENRKTHRLDSGGRQTFAWVENLQYVDDHGRQQQFNAFECREQIGQDKRFFAWITNFSIRPETVAALANRGGRCRWKIENEGFNIQKNGGFNLEHAYSTKDHQIKQYYILMQLAHLILQLLERGSLLSRNCKKLFGSLRNLARRLAESIRHYLIQPEALDVAAAACVQIRLDTS
jgi:hypothetical protein